VTIQLKFVLTLNSYLILVFNILIKLLFLLLFLGKVGLAVFGNGKNTLELALVKQNTVFGGTLNDNL